ncbi:MAG: hypothetical protein M1813_002019 [Trichoglossum hirsutum]|nr:MAG: hypothetical protein M1813_002019 [Trichoglossum hirsutum]
MSAKYHAETHQTGAGWFSTLTGYQCPAYNFRRPTGQNKLVRKKRVEFRKLKTRKRMRKRMKKRKENVITWWDC